MLLTVSPFYHYNSADYQGGAERFSRHLQTPIRPPTTEACRRPLTQTSGETMFKSECTDSVSTNTTSSITYSPTASKLPRLFDWRNRRARGKLRQRQVRSDLVADFDCRRSPIALHGGIVENATDPRFGVAVKVPHLNWVFRAFYGDFYQAPPLVTATGCTAGFRGPPGFFFRSPAWRAG